MSHLYKKLKDDGADDSRGEKEKALAAGVPRAAYGAAQGSRSVRTEDYGSSSGSGFYARELAGEGNSSITISPRPPLWGSTEFLFYYVCIVFAVVCMCRETYYISREEHPNYTLYAHRLQKGWLFGRKVDNSDLQFGMFRNNYVLLLFAMAGYLLLSHAVRHLVPKPTPKNPSRPLYRAHFFLAFSLCFLAFLFGASVLKIIAIVSVNYALARALGSSSWGPGLTWAFNLAVLFGNEIYHGYRFRDLDERLAGLDVYNGIARWYVFFNITMLRIVSFNMDYYWSHQVPRNAVEEPPTEKARIAQPCRRDNYNFVYYMAYLLYTPLYLAGPIITYNSFISQLRHPPREITVKGTLVYGARLLICVLAMEFILHFFYVVAISKEKAWGDYTPFQIMMVGYWNLKVIWLKLLIIWRFFRFWAMADGINAPENMVRCMSNNYSAQGFWRSWHRSYNRWLIRYVYVPLGGSKYSKYNIWVVFTFVALWHDLSMNLLAWGWLICLFIMPEVVCTAYFGRRKVCDIQLLLISGYWASPDYNLVATESKTRTQAQFRRWKFYRHFAALGGVLNIILMMAANLVGFAVGLDGLRDMAGKIRDLSGVMLIAGTGVALFSAVQIMFEIRESEKSAMLDIRC